MVFSLAALLGSVDARAADDLLRRVEDARELAGADPNRAIAAVQQVRTDALAAHRVDARFAADEVECRILTDLDVGRALAVADEGIHGVDTPPSSARTAWLRLRACRAEMLLESGEETVGLAELDALLAQTAAPADGVVRALVQTARGAYRSRHGELSSGQADLLEACAALAAAPRADRDLCLHHLSNHYRRIGDMEEALRLLEPLRAAARARGARYDDSVYTFGVARALQLLGRWDEAIEAFRETEAASDDLGDQIGVAYAAHRIAECLVEAGRPAEALPQVERAIALIGAESDPWQYEAVHITLAEALLGVGRARESLAALDKVAAPVEARGDASSRARWHLARGRASSALGRWQDAYQALTVARTLERELDRERLSDQSARLRMAFNRERDADELGHLRLLNQQGQALRRTQAVALALLAALIAALSVVAARKIRQARRLQGLASTDELTGLPNRREVLQRLAERGPLAVLMIDVDFFKRINDTHGHVVGDDVLRHLARVLTAHVRDGDLLGRLGGEEFVAVLPATELPQALEVAERLRAAVAGTPLLRRPEPVGFTISVGAAVRADGEATEALLARADGALYQAKGAGRNVVVAA